MRRCGTPLLRGAGDAGRRVRTSLEASGRYRLTAADAQAVRAGVEPLQGLPDLGQPLGGLREQGIRLGPLEGKGGALGVVLVVTVGVLARVHQLADVMAQVSDQLGGIPLLDLKQRTELLIPVGHFPSASLSSSQRSSSSSMEASSPAISVESAPRPT